MTTRTAPRTTLLLAPIACSGDGSEDKTDTTGSDSSADADADADADSPCIEALLG